MMEIPKPNEGLRTPDRIIRALNPENPLDVEIAHQLDLASLEALNPFNHELDPEKAHDQMTPYQLKRWMTDRKNGMLRVIETPNAQGGKDAIGFVYLYNDHRGDKDFRQRASECRKRNGLAQNISVWEMNFWVPEGTDDGIVKNAVEQTMSEFENTKIQRKTTLVMFADQEDMTETSRMMMREGELENNSTKSPGKISSRSILERLSRNPTEKASVEQSFQDTRILKQAGFTSAGEMKYSPADKLLDWMYTRIIPHAFRRPSVAPAIR